MTQHPPLARSSFREGWARDRVWLTPLLVLFAAKGVFLALLFGPFTGHDEVDHFFYIQRLAQGHGLGVFGKVMLPPEAEPYQKLVADYPYNAEVIQPPLYHLLMAPVYLVAPGGLFGKLLTIRLVSVLAGCGVVLLAYGIVQEFFPEDIGVRAATVAFVALQPQFSFEAAIVNHDIQVILLATLAVWLSIVWTRTGLTFARTLWLGLVIGAGILTKVSSGLVIPVLLCVMWRFGRRRGDSWRELVHAAVVTCGAGMVVASPWFIRSTWLYGDPTGAQQLRSIPGYGSQAQPVLTMLRSAPFWRGRLEDFWGNFGWRLIPFDPGTYHVIYWAWFAAGAGLFVALVLQGAVALRGRGWPFTAIQLDGLLVMFVWVAMMIAGVLYVGTIQFTQSRFAFPGMAAFGLLTAAGVAAPLPTRVRWLAGPIVLLAMLTLDVTTTIRFVIPFYAGRGGLAGMLP